MKALVLSGGGAAGPYHLGVMEKLYAEGQRYDLFCGVSVGALIASHMAQYSTADETRGLRDIRNLFYRIKTSSIHRGWMGGPITGLLWERSLRNSSPLARLVRKLLDRDKVRSSGKKLRLGAVNLNSGKYVWFDEQEEFLHEATLASSSFPVMFKPVRIRGDWHTDGGVRTVTPIQEAIDAGATHIDVVLCVPPEGATKDDFGTALDVGVRCLSLAMDEIISNDLLAMRHSCEQKGISFRFWRPKTTLLKDSLKFDPEEARRLYLQGYRDAKKHPKGM